jgi:type II secretory pathway component GspD/PulD (secretin)
MLSGVGLAIVPAVCADEGEPEAPSRPLSPFVTEDGEVRTIFRPEFRAATTLLSNLGQFEIEGLRVELVGPRVPSPDPKQPPVPSRLLLGGRPEVIARARELLGHLDVPRPAVMVSLLAAEIRSISRRQRGGHFLFDRTLSPDLPKTLFRGAASNFEPDAYLRSALIGQEPFGGTSIRFGHVGQKLLDDGAFELVLRMLVDRGDAEFLAWPTIFCTEGTPGTITSAVLVPQRVLTQADQDGISRVEGRTERTGIELKATPFRVGSDAVVLDLETELRLAEPTRGGQLTASPLVVRTRRVRTRVTVRDRETLFLGGLKLRRVLHGGRGVPLLSELPGIDVLTSSDEGEVLETELVLLVRARIVVPGGSRVPTRHHGGGGVLPPGRARRLDAGEHTPGPAVPPPPPPPPPPVLGEGEGSGG